MDRIYFTLTHRGTATAVSIAYGLPPPLVFTFRRVSDGMAQNAVLAICAALWLGVPAPSIQARLGAWQPAPLRGEIRRDGDRLLYLDCYNANPASMADALAVFRDVAPAGQPRLYVIGGMEELGAESAAYHEALGRSLVLRPEDRLYAIGDQAHAVCAGALQNNDVSAQLQIVSTLDPVRATLATWTGAVFVKGSRKYRLETILETTAPLPC